MDKELEKEIQMCWLDEADDFNSTDYSGLHSEYDDNYRTSKISCSDREASGMPRGFHDTDSTPGNYASAKNDLMDVES